MAADPKVLEAVALLRQAGRLDLLKEGALEPGRPAARAACSPPRLAEKVRRLSLALAGHALPHHHVRLKVAVREDLRMWVSFLESFNGIPLQVWREWEWEAQLFSDAAGSSGFGLYWEGRWCAEEWPKEWKQGGRSIAFLEFFQLIVAVCLWGEELSHSRVLFRVDNLAVVQMVNRQSAREAGLLQLLRVFVLQCLRNDIQFSAKHVPGVHNDIADALSRSQWERFHGLTTGSEGSWYWALRACTYNFGSVAVSVPLVIEVADRMADEKVRAALALLRQAGRMDLVRAEALATWRPARRASAGVVAAVMACSLPRAGSSGTQLRGVGRGVGRPGIAVEVWAGRGRARRRIRESRGLPLGRGALELRVGEEERPAAAGEARLYQRASRL
ncbi:hypothetical protein NDU88_000947 [Pleurodeles waltl]|uniref:RNase H type-1 domain-containing protein n=1 Tax=Pleurodeles waltl TaxID=8319 RepID=A0AAV7USV9_PLEWA|nr:hypothetical protein NDU88_000947 [Pleurodeles waltl]